MRSLWIMVGPKPNSMALEEKEKEIQTHREGHVKMAGDWSYIATSQGIPGLLATTSFKERDIE